MKKMRTIIAVLLCMMMVLAMFAGCQQETADKSDSSTSSSSSSTSSSDKKDDKKEEEKKDDAKEEKVEEDSNFIYDGDSPIATEPVTVTMLCSGGGSSVSYNNVEDMSWVQAIIEKSGLDIQMECLDSTSYGDSVRPRLAAGVDLPDIMSVPGSDEDMTYINSGIFLNLNELYDKYAFNYKWRCESNPTVEGQLRTPDGDLFYMAVINMAVDYCPTLMYNQFWLDQIGMEEPKTTDELYEVLSAMKGVDFNGNGEDDEIPMFIQTGYMMNALAWWGCAKNGYYENDEGIVEPSYVSDRYLDYLTYWNKLYEEKLITPDFASISADMQNQMSTNDQFGFTIHYLNYCHPLSQNYWTGKGVEWDTSYGELAWVPTLQPMTGPYGHTQYIGNDPLAGYWAISAESEVPEYAFAFIDYQYSEEANNFLYYGIYENGDYEIRDGKIYPDLAKRSKDDYATKQGNNFAGLPRILLAAHRDVSYNYTIGEYNAKIRDYYRLPTPKTFALPEEIDTVQMYSTDLSTYWNESFSAFITGEKDLSEFDSYCETLLSMGYEDIVAVKQAQLDRVHGK